MEFANNSLNSQKIGKLEIGKLNIDTLIISKGLLIHEKTRVQKSRATVPLKELEEGMTDHMARRKKRKVM